MDDNTRIVLIALIAALPGTLAGLAALLKSNRNAQDIMATDRRAEEHMKACHPVVAVPVTPSPDRPHGN